MEHITKRFPGVLASDDISINVGEGEVLALVGENGAGKTTLMNILMGLYQPDEGRILINGQSVKFRGPEDAFRAGLGMVHQTYMLVPNMTVTENVALGYRNTGKKRFDMKAVRQHIEEISGKYGLSVNPDAYIWQLSVGEQQKVELVKTLCLGARFLILDDSLQVPEQEIDKVSMCFTLPHKSGSLAQVLTILSFYDMNLTRIQSLPIPGREWQYFFYVDIKFDSYERYRQALTAVRPLMEDLNILGEYRAAI